MHQVTRKQLLQSRKTVLFLLRECLKKQKHIQAESCVFVTIFPVLSQENERLER